MTALYEGRFLRFEKRGDWEYCSRQNAHAVVAIVAVTQCGKLLLTEQHRPPLDCCVIELPAGLAGDEPGAADEPLSAAAGRELEEECGYRAHTLDLLTFGPTSGGLTDEVIHFFHARNLEQTGAGGGVEGEDITVHAIALDDVPDWLKQCQERGLLVDPKIYTGLYFLQQEK